MDSPFSASSRPPALLDRPEGPGTTSRDEVVLVASFGDTLSVDYAAFVGRHRRGQAVVVAGEEIRGLVEAPARFLPIVEFSGPTPPSPGDPDRIDFLILFLDSTLDENQRRQMEELLHRAQQGGVGFIGIVSTFRVHLDDPEAREAEDFAHSRASELPARVVVFRPGHVLGPHSATSRLLRRFAAWNPLPPARLRSCFLEAEELYRVIEAERLDWANRAVAGEAGRPKAAGRPLGREDRAYTLLGSNRPWREVMAEHRSASLRQSLTTALAWCLSWLGLGHLLALALNLASRRIPRLRQWDMHTLTPRSIRELVSLCHRLNIDRVKVVGYNNGVVHFGRQYPGKTVVSTVHCRRLALAGPDRLRADCGATIRQALDFLASGGRELYVVPNYSYVCMGTAFFVPIHGSAIDFSTVADTIRKVVLYDPDSDRIIVARRDDPAFADHAYDLRSRLVLLRLDLLAKPRSGYFVRHEILENPPAETLLAAFHDGGPTNVEIRQAHASSPIVRVSRYFKEAGDTSAPALELPRDALGRLWDRLEENPLTSYLMHAVGRHAVWHEELFIKERDFPLFWETHGRLPLRKLQLRAIRRDGMAHSPFRDEDCISVDLFMIRWHRRRFLDYLRTTLPAVRTNPGKHGN
jgi:hypothetical protein